MGFGTQWTTGIWLHKDLEEDTPIYHFFRRDYFEGLLKKQELYMESLLGWNDPWEIPARYICNIDNLADDYAKFRLCNQYEVTAKRDNGICFTKDFDTDAMWRQYADKNKNPEKCEEYLCIETTVKDFLEALDKSGVVSGFVAPVIYLNLSGHNGEELFRNSNLVDYPERVYMAFVKRISFSHEREVRAVFSFYSNRLEEGIKVKIDPKKFVKKIYLNPHWAIQKAEMIKNEYENLGIPVEQSKLYSLPKISVSNFQDIQKEWDKRGYLISPETAKKYVY